jgi:nitrous-oxide reductase
MLAAVLAAVVAGCGGGASPAADVGDAAQRVYVAPGQYDEFYFFASGGFSGQVAVYGLPSGRLLKVVPVFSQNAENAWGYSEQTKAMLNTSYGFVPWDDSHHPELSMTNGVPDGRWLFINGNNTPRVARLDLTTFEAVEILEIPHSAGNHASPFVTENTEYAVAATRFSVPTPQEDVSISQYKEKFRGLITFIKVDSATGRMKIAFQILMPGFDYDLSHSGKGPSHGWSFFTSYNSEQASTLKEVNASQNDKDFIAAVNWKQAEKCVAEGKAKAVPAVYAHNVMEERSQTAATTMEKSVTMLEAAACPGVVYYLPTPKSPHGVDVDPTGEFIVAGGKLATVIPVHSFSKMLKAIEAHDFAGEVSGVPVLKYESIVAGEVKEPGLGPLHTEFDGKGNAYTSMFVSSEIVKWSLKDFTVLDRIPTYYSIGHLSIPGGDSREPWGKYVIALNKITKDRYLPTGPELAQAAQLIDITGDKMRLLLDFPTIGEPHYAQALPAALIKDRQVRTFDDQEQTLRPRTGRRRRRAARCTSDETIRSTSRRITSRHPGRRLGVFHITNLEQDWDVPHGFALTGLNSSELLVMPGQTRTVVWVPSKVGVFPFYCTDFCSALHQEMQGYVRVSPRGSSVALVSNSAKK